MVEYGIFEDGLLRVKTIEPVVQRCRDSKTGEIKQVTITEEEQIKLLPPGWKPLDSIDESKHETDREYYTIRIVPYDAGDRISYNYVEVPDIQRIRHEIDSLKEELTNSDYQVIKCYESSMLGKTLPYDLVKLTSERQSIRDKINDLEAKKTSLMNL